MRITNEQQYGFAILLYLSERKNKWPISAAQMARDMGLRHSLVASMCRRLRNVHLLESVRSQTGGYFPTRTVNALDILTAIGYSRSYQITTTYPNINKSIETVLSTISGDLNRCLEGIKFNIQE